MRKVFFCQTQLYNQEWHLDFWHSKRDLRTETPENWQHSAKINYEKLNEKLINEMEVKNTSIAEQGAILLYFRFYSLWFY